MSVIDFVHNLSRDTHEALEQNLLTPDSYLLAPNNATADLRQRAALLRDAGLDLLSDNGNFVEIGRIRKLFATEAAALLDEVREFERQTLGHSIRRGEMPDSLEQRYRDLANRAAKAAREAVAEPAAMVADQLALNPTALIGVEDITMACWLSLDIERVYTGIRRSRYRNMNRRIARAAIQQIPTLPGFVRHRYFPVASAVSHDTACDAGREFAAASLRAVSMGFGAYMADSNFTDHMYINQRRFDFGANLPARYMRTVFVARGFREGYREVLGRSPLRFHFLGLGAPIMLPLVALASRGTSELTFDATSPIKDATRDGVLYVEEPAPLKIRIRQVVHRLAATPSRIWDCPCPFCTRFAAEHPFDYPLGHAWFQDTAATKVLARDLAPGGALHTAYPLFSEPAAGSPLRRLVNFSRIGHNHWVVEQILSKLRTARSQGLLQRHVAELIDAYVPLTSPPFAKAIQLSFHIARGVLPDNEP